MRFFIYSTDAKRFKECVVEPVRSILPQFDMTHLDVGIFDIESDESEMRQTEFCRRYFLRRLFAQKTSLDFVKIRSIDQRKPPFCAEDLSPDAKSVALSRIEKAGSRKRDDLLVVLWLDTVESALWTEFDRILRPAATVFIDGAGSDKERRRIRGLVAQEAAARPDAGETVFLENGDQLLPCIRRRFANRRLERHEARRKPTFAFDAETVTEFAQKRSTAVVECIIADWIDRFCEDILIPRIAEALKNTPGVRMKGVKSSWFHRAFDRIFGLKCATASMPKIAADSLAAHWETTQNFTLMKYVTEICNTYFRRFDLKDTDAKRLKEETSERQSAHDRPTAGEIWDPVTFIEDRMLEEIDGFEGFRDMYEKCGEDPRRDFRRLAFWVGADGMREFLGKMMTEIYSKTRDKAVYAVSGHLDAALSRTGASAGEIFTPGRLEQMVLVPRTPRDFTIFLGNDINANYGGHRDKLQNISIPTGG